MRLRYLASSFSSDKSPPPPPRSDKSSDENVSAQLIDERHSAWDERVVSSRSQSAREKRESSRGLVFQIFPKEIPSFFISFYKNILHLYVEHIGEGERNGENYVYALEEANYLNFDFNKFVLARIKRCAFVYLEYTSGGNGKLKGTHIHTHVCTYTCISSRKA